MKTLARERRCKSLTSSQKWISFSWSRRCFLYFCNTCFWLCALCCISPGVAYFAPSSRYNGWPRLDCISAGFFCMLNVPNHIMWFKIITALQMGSKETICTSAFEDALFFSMRCGCSSELTYTARGTSSGPLDGPRKFDVSTLLSSSFSKRCPAFRIYAFSDYSCPLKGLKEPEAQCSDQVVWYHKLGFDYLIEREHWLHLCTWSFLRAIFFQNALQYPRCFFTTL